MKIFVTAVRFILVGFVLLVLAALAVFYQPDIPVEQLKQKYAVAPSQFVSIQNMNVHFRDEGPASDSIPLVLLHGTSASLLTWNACVEEWSKNHRVIRMDLPAFGLTGSNPKADYSIEAYVSFLHSFLQTRNVRQCYLAGNSLGGLIAFSYAAAYPKEVKKLILIDAAGYRKGMAKGSLAFTLARIPGLNKILTVVTPTALVRKSIEDVYGNKALVTNGLVQQYKDMACREGNRKALVKRLNMTQVGDTTLVAKLATPTLVVWGELDQLIPLANATRFHDDLPSDTLVVLKGVGHVPMEEAPEQLIPLVNHFLKK